MLDFFDEDFPLTKKQEEMKKAIEEAAKKAALAEAHKLAESNPLPVNTSPAAAEPVPVEQPAEAVSETIAEAVSKAVAEPIVETIPEVTAEPIAETAAEPMAEAVPEIVVEAVPEITAEHVAEIPTEPIAEVVPEAVPEAVAETVPEIAAAPIAEIPAEPIAEVVSEAVPEAVAEAVPEISTELLQDEIPQREPQTAQSDKEDEEAAIKRIFQPIHEERDLPESDNQEFSYEYDGRYFAEEETPAYKYGASSYPRRRTRPARPAEAKGGNITVSTKTLLKVGAVVAATAAAVKLLSKKD